MENLYLVADHWWYHNYGLNYFWKFCFIFYYEKNSKFLNFLNVDYVSVKVTNSETFEVIWKNGDSLQFVTKTIQIKNSKSKCP